MAHRLERVAATASLEGGCTPPHDAHGLDFPAGIPTSAPSGPPQNVSAQSHTCNLPLRAQESAPALASLLPGRAARCSSPRSTSSTEAHHARLPQAHLLLPKLKSRRPPAALARDH